MLACRHSKALNSVTAGTPFCLGRLCLCLIQVRALEGILQDINLLRIH